MVQASVDQSERRGRRQKVIITINVLPGLWSYSHGEATGAGSCYCSILFSPSKCSVHREAR